MEFVVLPCYKALGSLAPIAATKGLAWMEHNTELWVDLLQKGETEAVISARADGAQEEAVAISPKPNQYHGCSAAWCAPRTAVLYCCTTGVLLCRKRISQDKPECCARCAAGATWTC